MVGPKGQPALASMLGIDIGVMVEWDGTPYECPGCPFAGESVEPWPDIVHDPSEAHYPCALLKRTVWGESAPCSRADWQARAREELDAVDISFDPGAGR